jgi:hypothetical protein
MDYLSLALATFALGLSLAPLRRPSAPHVVVTPPANPVNVAAPPRCENIAAEYRREFIAALIRDMAGAGDPAVTQPRIEKLVWIYDNLTKEKPCSN